MNDCLLIVAGTDTLHITLTLLDDSITYSQQLDLTSLQTNQLIHLKHLWINGSIDARHIFRFERNPKIESLNITHLHFNLRLKYFTNCSDFFELLRHLEVLDIRNTVYFGGMISFSDAFQAISSSQLSAISLRKYQSFDETFYSTLLDLEKVLPMGLRDHLIYLDLSKNDLTVINLDFLKLTSLVILDLSENAFTQIMYDSHVIQAVLLFHPTIQVLDIGRQYMGHIDSYITSNYNMDTLHTLQLFRQKRELSGNGLFFDIDKKLKGIKNIKPCLDNGTYNVNDLFMNRTVFSRLLNCYLHSEFPSSYPIPTEYVKS